MDNFFDNLKNVLDIPDLNKIKNAKESQSILLSTTLILKYLNDLRRNKLTCAYSNTDKMIFEDEIIMFDHVSYTLRISKKMEDNLKSCLKDDIIIIPIGINSPLLSNIKHLNIILIDKKNKTFEYFEPLGKNNSIFIPSIDVPGTIYNCISDILNFKTYQFINASDTCPIGLQEIDNPKEYRCGAWCMFILYLKIYNRSMSIPQITNVITSNLNKYVKLSDVIKKFMSFIENEYKDGIFDNIINEYDLFKYNEHSQILVQEFHDKTQNYLKRLIGHGDTNTSEDKLNFYNYIFLNKIPQFHLTIEKILKGAFVNVYNQGKHDCLKNEPFINDSEMSDSDNEISDSDSEMSYNDKINNGLISMSMD